MLSIARNLWIATCVHNGMLFSGKRGSRYLPAAILSAALLATGQLRAQQAAADLPEAPRPAADAGMPRAESTEVQQALLRQKNAEAASLDKSSVSCTVLDQTGAVIPGELILVKNVPEGTRAVLTDQQGHFSVNALPLGRFILQIGGQGFHSQTLSVTVGNDAVNLQNVTLAIDSGSSVQVTATEHDIAEAQVKLEEKQRVFGVFPNYYISYLSNAVPLTPREKFGLATHSLVDPVSFVLAGATAGFEQASDSLQGYGEGAQGYGKRFGATLADSSVSTMLGGAVFPTLLRQDPRYFWKGTGSKRARIGYAVSRVVICRGDNGRWQPNYSNLMGNFASAGISNLYYPDTDRDGAGLTIRNVLTGTATGALANLYQEFFSRHMTPSASRFPASAQGRQSPDR